MLYILAFIWGLFTARMGIDMFNWKKHALIFWVGVILIIIAGQIK